jgi:hypothetical protein
MEAREIDRGLESDDGANRAAGEQSAQRAQAEALDLRNMRVCGRRLDRQLS